MGLHPRLEERLEFEAETYPDLTQIPVGEARASVREMAAETDRLAGGAPSVAQVRDTSFRGPGGRVRVRVYTPVGDQGRPPAVAYLHGGGWVFGDLETHDSICREIANRAEAVVVAVDYRRAPEHRFPAALEDSLAAVRWLGDPATADRLGYDAARLAVAGDDVGGNLALGVVRDLRGTPGPRLSAAVLVYPVVAYEPGTPSYTESASGFGLEASFMAWAWRQYLASPDQGHDPRVSPVEAGDLSGLPPTLIQTAECDILRDEGERLGDLLRTAGVPVTVTRYPGMVHGFVDYRGLAEEGWRALEEIGMRLGATLARPPPRTDPPAP